jgi:hypothetical protein
MHLAKSGNVLLKVNFLNLECYISVTQSKNIVLIFVLGILLMCGNGSIAPRSSGMNIVAFVYLYTPNDGCRIEKCSVTVI